MPVLPRKTSKTNQRRGSRESAATVVASAREPPNPNKLADLELAWAELPQTAEEAGVTNFHACTGNGTHWQEEPDVVRRDTRAAAAGRPTY